jgi:hypothetical protein
MAHRRETLAEKKSPIRLKAGAIDVSRKYRNRIEKIQLDLENLNRVH